MVARNESTDPIADAAEELLSVYPPEHAFWKTDWLKELPAAAETGSVEFTRLQILVHAAITARARGAAIDDHHIAKAIHTLIVGGTR